MSYKECAQDFKDLFRLAGLGNPTRFYEIANEYCSKPDCCGPWILAIITLGSGTAEIKIGWRKRVVNIDWSATGLDLEIFFKDDVTKGPGFIHAWGYAKTLEYLSKLSFLLRCTPEQLDAHKAHAKEK